MLNFPGKDWLKATMLEKVGRRAKCLFVLSPGRSGTSLLTRLLALSSQIDAAHEPFPDYRVETLRAYHEYPLAPELEAQFCQDYGTSRVRALVRAKRNGGYYAECGNRLTYFVPIFASYFPDSRFIHLHRNPGDSVRSFMRRMTYRRTGILNDTALTPRPDDPAAAKWPAWEPFEKCCWYWKAVNEFSLEVTQAMPTERVFSMSAEALFDDRGATAQAMFNWLGVAAPSTEETCRVISTPENQNPSSPHWPFPRWEEWSDEQKRSLSEIAGNVALRLGYERWVCS